jgi:hypothetical protein
VLTGNGRVVGHLAQQGHQIVLGEPVQAGLDVGGVAQLGQSERGDVLTQARASPVTRTFADERTLGVVQQLTIPSFR